MTHASFGWNSFAFGVDGLVTDSIIRLMTESLSPEWSGIPYLKCSLSMPSRIPYPTKDEVEKMLYFVRSFDLAIACVNIEQLEKTMKNWDSMTDYTRNLGIRRAFWLAMIIEAFA